MRVVTTEVANQVVEHMTVMPSAVGEPAEFLAVMVDVAFSAAEGVADLKDVVRDVELVRFLYFSIQTVWFVY